MKLTDIATSPNSEYEYLRAQVDALPENCLYILDCVMPEGCLPESTTLRFCRAENQYIAYLKPRVAYSGDHPQLDALCRNPYLPFGSWDALVGFLRLLPSDAAPPQAPLIAHENAPSFAYLRNELKKSVIGQDEAVDAVAFQTAQFLKKRHSSRPMSAVLFGPPASGKSECAKALAKLLSPSYHTVWTDLNQYTEAHSVGRLIGAPPSYVGYDDPPVFSEVASHRKTVFIFDELEKAHPEVLKLFMGILDEGRCQSNRRLEDGSRT